MKTVENTEGTTTSKEREIEVCGGGNETEGGGDKLTLATVGRWWVSSKLGTEERSSKKKQDTQHFERVEFSGGTNRESNKKGFLRVPS